MSAHDARVALVTGAGRRIGQAIAVALGERRMRVVVHYHGSEAGARETAARITASGGEAHCVRADLADTASAMELVRAAVDTFGGLDVLVNSAGVMERTPIGGVTAEQWDAMFAVNLRAPFFLSQAAAPALRERRGAIVNIADLAAFETWPSFVPHTISKAGVVQLTRAMARALAPDVRVNAVAPGVVLMPEGWDPAATERLAGTTPLRRIGEPKDVVQAVLYLLDAGFVTGETLLVDGGRHVRK